jgi:hypothetical protein
MKMDRINFKPLGNPHLSIIGIDLNRNNVELILNITSSSQIKKLANLNFDGVTIYPIHAAGGDMCNTMRIPKCAFGEEGCKLQHDDKGDSENVQIIAADQIISEFIRSHNISDKHQNNILVDILQIDTEGHDPAVIDGAVDLISKQRVRCVVFEYLWQSRNLKDVIAFFTEHKYNCYMEGQSRLWPLTGTDYILYKILTNISN